MTISKKDQMEEINIIGTENIANRIYALANKFKEYSERYESKKDERAICALAFYLLHVELSSSMRSNELGFTDLDWVATLAENFAQRFFDAMDSIDRTLAENPNEDLTGEFYKNSDFKPWIDVYLATCTERSYVFECLMFPLLAHIGYDLPLALVKTGLATNGTSRIDDYYYINDVLASRIDVVQKDIATRYRGRIAFLDKITGQFDEFLTNYGMRVCRAVAWYNANRMLAPSLKEQTVGSLESTAKTFIQNSRNPKKTLPRIINSFLRAILPVNKTWPNG